MQHIPRHVYQAKPQPQSSYTLEYQLHLSVCPYSREGAKLSYPAPLAIEEGVVGNTHILLTLRVQSKQI